MARSNATPSKTATQAAATKPKTESVKNQEAVPAKGTASAASGTRAPAKPAAKSGPGAAVKAPAANKVLTMIFMVVSLRRAQPQRTCSMMPVCSL